ncbi:MAG: ABC transporter ATP-binding protein [Acetobacteraceae bacterium]
MTAEAILDHAAPAGPLIVPFTEPDRARGGIGYERVSVAYKGTTVLFDFNLAVRPGEIMALIGPSGSGKTTALRVTAGFVRPTTGRVHIGGRDVTDLPPYARSIGVVVQNYALFPHMRVADNVAFGLRARGAPASTIGEQIRTCLSMVGMESYTRRYPRELSGGQQQRVAIARALAVQPEVLLLDEPLSALDAQIRLSMLEELARLHRNLPSLTVIYVTHDQTEALTLADRIGIMRDGRLVALGDCQGLYCRPPNRFAAEFLGRANLLRVTVEAADASRGFARVRFGALALSVSRSPEISVGQDVLLCVRPHDLHLESSAESDNRILARVSEVRWKGECHDVGLEAEGQKLRVVAPPLKRPPEPGAMLRLYFAPDDASLIPLSSPSPSGRGSG